MRERAALYVDAGYLLSASATRVAGTSLRGAVTVDYAELASALITHAEASEGLKVLRINWYDAGRHGTPSLEQEQIALLPRLKLRLGRTGYDGEQKGVDLRIGLDMLTHARNGAADVFFLVSGDDDLTEAVEEAQAHGVQVTVLAIPDAAGNPHGVSRHLRMAADSVEVFSGEIIDALVERRAVADTAATGIPSPAMFGGTHRPAAPVTAAVPTVGGPSRRVSEPAPRTPVHELVYSSATGAAPTGQAIYVDDVHLTEQIDEVCRRVLLAWLRSATPEARTALEAGRPQIPRDIDRTLLVDLSDARGEYDLTDSLRYRLRERFWVVRDEHGMPDPVTEVVP
ncbi:MAG TPA: NYN domain-containing protein [Microbacterium sp.]|uniref:NYN domain-containing protein n=1 Tax=Microbacterium sp. TaxID=51671 RepID=UPI002B48CD4E|nr:NYN domain-containing protein [Microbacterium sp.]HKT55805.1 NYN domain-containing protein [Microbacterium sp.]